MRARRGRRWFGIQHDSARGGVGRTHEDDVRKNIPEGVSLIPMNVLQDVYMYVCIYRRVMLKKRLIKKNKKNTF